MSCVETIDWIENTNTTHSVPSLETLKSWLVVGRKKLTIDDEAEFVYPEYLQSVLNVSQPPYVHRFCIGVEWSLSCIYVYSAFRFCRPTGELKCTCSLCQS